MTLTYFRKKNETNREVFFPQNFLFGERHTPTFPPTLRSGRSQSPLSRDQRSHARSTGMYVKLGC